MKKFVNNTFKEFFNEHNIFPVEFDCLKIRELFAAPIRMITKKINASLLIIKNIFLFHAIFPRKINLQLCLILFKITYTSVVFWAGYLFFMKNLMILDESISP